MGISLMYGLLISVEFDLENQTKEFLGVRIEVLMKHMRLKLLRMRHGILVIRMS